MDILDVVRKRLGEDETDFLQDALSAFLHALMDAEVNAQVGLLAGVLSGLFGIGGGLIIVPTLSLLVGLEFHEAAGTSLAALLLPVGGLRAYAYWRQGNVNLAYALLLALGLFGGAVLGVALSRHVHPQVIERAFGVLLLAVGGPFSRLGWLSRWPILSGGSASRLTAASREATRRTAGQGGRC